MPRDDRLPNESSAKRRPWAQFTLKSLLVAIVLSAAIFSWLRRWLPSQALSVRLTANGTIVFNGQEGSVAAQARALESAVQSASRAGKVPEVAIVADSQALYTDVQRVLEVLQRGGVQRITFRSPDDNAAAH